MGGNQNEQKNPSYPESFPTQSQTAISALIGEWEIQQTPKKRCLTDLKHLSCEDNFFRSSVAPAYLDSEVQVITHSSKNLKG